MFGYVKPVAKELLVKEYEFYKATYCGICRSCAFCRFHFLQQGCNGRDETSWNMEDREDGRIYDS